MEKKERVTAIIDCATKYLMYPKGSDKYDPADGINLMHHIREFQKGKLISRVYDLFAVVMEIESVLIGIPLHQKEGVIEQFIREGIKKQKGQPDPEVMEETLEYVLQVIEGISGGHFDAWWIDNVSSGGFDVERIKKAINAD
jgi:hypothetical protein